MYNNANLNNNGTVSRRQANYQLIITFGVTNDALDIIIISKRGIRRNLGASEFISPKNAIGKLIVWTSKPILTKLQKHL